MRSRWMTLPAAVAVALLTATACSAGGETAGGSASPSPGVVRLWVGPEMKDCVTVAPTKCLEVSYSDGGEKQLFYDTIEGFDYQEGTSYVIDVTVTDIPSPPADGSSKKYTLVTVVEPS